MDRLQVITILLVVVVLVQNHFFRRSIMSKVTEAAEATKAALARANASLTGIKGDVDSLKAKIDALNNSSGELSPEDQAALDEIVADANALADKTGAIDAETDEDATGANPGE